jgi:N-acetyl-beta-hexosaminidase
MESYGKPDSSVGIMPSMFHFQLLNSTGAVIAPPPSLKAAFDRYVGVTFPKKSGEICGYLLASLDLTVDDASEKPPSISDDETYQIDVPEAGGAATLHAASLHGAMRGLETFSQLVTMNAQKQYGVAGVPVSIKDEPAYHHRGLMIDSGRRFVPLPTVKVSGLRVQ